MVTLSSGATNLVNGVGKLILWSCANDFTVTSSLLRRYIEEGGLIYPLSLLREGTG